MSYLNNFFAFCLPILIITFWGIIGYAALVLLRTQRNTIQNILLAPITGFSITLLPVFWLNRIGIPIAHFANILFILLISSSIIFLRVRKFFFPIKHYIPFIFIFLLALFITGRPLLQFGFDWISYGNDDMANYCLGALRFLNHGYFDTPNINDLTQGKDLSLYTWFLYIPVMTRSGSEIVLAFVSGVTHLNPLYIFMPVILSLHLMLISTVGALVCVGKHKRKIALLACILLSVSALTSLGTLYQLIAQVAGLSLLIACVTLILQPFSVVKKFYSLRLGVLIAITVSVLFITYPELIPFLVLSFFIYFAYSFISNWRLNKSMCVSFGFASIFIVLFLNVYLITSIFFILKQLNHASAKASAQAAVFPYYLLPSGLANLWGLQALSVLPDEPWMSISIILAIFLSIILATFTLRLIRIKTHPAAIVTLVMIGLGLILFYKSYSFGLFKLSMYIQPFIVGVMAIALFELVKNKLYKTLLILSLLFLGLPTLNFYVSRSKAISPGSFSEIAYGSHSKINTEFARVVAKTPKDSILLSDDFNTSITKFQELQSRMHRFISIGFQAHKISASNTSQKIKAPAVIKKLFYQSELSELSRQLQLQKVNFNLHDNDYHKLSFLQNDELQDKLINDGNAFVVADTPLRSIINSRRYNESRNHNFNLIKYDTIKNHMIFTVSHQGSIYNYPIGPTSLYNIELDVTYPQNNMQLIGKYLLFTILKPSSIFRLGMSVTNTYDGDGVSSLPQAFVIGDSRTKLAFIGRGSARIFSDPISAQSINNIPYVALEINKEKKKLRHVRNGIMAMYGKRISIDSRKSTTFARDISLISEDEYQRLNPPNSLKHFPDDLANVDLEYSGIYEDGWVSEDAFFNLKQPSINGYLKIKGMLPKIADLTESTLTILIDGEKQLDQKLKLGNFTVTIPVTAKQIGRRKVELHFSKIQRLPKGDDRPIGALLNYIGFDQSKTNELNIPTSIQSIPKDLANEDLEYDGIYNDGWLYEHSFFILNQPSLVSNLKIKGMLPNLKDLSDSVVTVILDGKKLTEQKLKPGKFDISIPVNAKQIGSRKVELQFSKAAQLSKIDARHASALMTFIGFETNKRS